MGWENFFNTAGGDTATSNPFGFMRNAKADALSVLQPPQQPMQNVLAQIGQSLLGITPQAPAPTAGQKPGGNMIRTALGLPPKSSDPQSSIPELPKLPDISSPNLDEQTKQQTIAQMLRGLG